MFNENPANTKLIGIKRANEVMDLVELFKYVTAQHIAKLVYAKLKPVSALRKARHRLQALHDEGKLNRFRESIYQSYVYYIGKRSSHADSCLQVLTFYTELVSNCKQWQKVMNIDIEKRIDFNDGTYIVADAFVKFKITEDKIVNFYLEVENSPHDFTKKINNYSKLSMELGLSRTIIPVVVLTAHNRKDRINARIKEQPQELVRFAVISPEDMRKDYLCWYKELIANAKKEPGKNTRENSAEKLGTIKGVRPGAQPGQVAPNMPSGIQRPQATSPGNADRTNGHN
jgi:hypothetical protein